MTATARRPAGAVAGPEADGSPDRSSGVPRVGRAGTDRARVEVPADRPLRWWREALAVAVFYAAYSWVRGRFGSGAVDGAEAFANARRVLAVEGRLGIATELDLQQWFLRFPAAVRALNVFYGFFHFVFPVTALVVLARRAPDRYRRSRNALAATTALALVGFALFPLMPPRLLCACAGGAGTSYGYVDTLERFGGLWTFGSHGMSAVSNQYAAMPSLHFAWALWCALALLPIVRSRTLRLLLVAYPTVTLLAIVVTANHFWLDAVGGAVIVAAGTGIAVLLERLPVTAPTKASATAGAPGATVPGVATPPALPRAHARPRTPPPAWGTIGAE